MDVNVWSPVSAMDAKFIVVPKWPTFDKMAAAWLVGEISEKVSIPIVTRAGQRIADATWQNWSDSGAYVLDLACQKYQRQGDGSTTATVMRVEGATGKVYEKLVALTNKNNETGCLKNGPHPIAKIMREAYELPGTQEGWVISSVMDVINMWELAQTMKKRQGTIDDFIEDPGNQETIESLQKNADGKRAFDLNELFNEFSVGQYAYNLWVIGEDQRMIQTKVWVWLNLEMQIRQEWLKLPDLYELEVKREFAQGKAIMVRTNSRKLPTWMWHQAKAEKGQRFQLIVTRRDKSDPRKRNAAILAGGKKLDLSGLANVLYLLEGHAHFDGFWYHQFGGQKSQANFLLNGTPERAVPATWLSDDQLVTLTESLVFKTKKLSQTQAEALADELIAGQPSNRKKINDLRNLLIVALMGNLPADFAETLIAEQIKAQEA